MATHFLKHKNIKVAELTIEDGEIYEISVFEKERLPFLNEENINKNIKLINSWAANRGIPLSREGYDRLIEKYHVHSTKELSILGMGLNLTDHYWVSGINDKRQWVDVNYHDNGFSHRLGELIPELEENDGSLMNPDFSSNGHLKKIWIIEDGKRYLLKAGGSDLNQEPFNEHIASVISDRLGIPHVEYTLHKYKNEIFSKCPYMVDKKLEFINSFSVYLHGDKDTDKYKNYIAICENNGIKNARADIDKMIVLDYLIRNTDRNSGNYGVLRDADTLQWVKIAPLFDNGNSLWYNTHTVNNIGAALKSECRSFTGENEKNIQLVGDMSWFNKKSLKGIDKEIINIFSLNKNIETERAQKIASSFVDRVHKIDKLLNTQKTTKSIHR